MTAKSATIDASDQDAILARAEEIRAERAAATEAERQQAIEETRARFAPLIRMVDDPSYKAVRDAAAEVRDQMMNPQSKLIYGMAEALVGLMDSIVSQVPADARAPAA